MAEFAADEDGLVTFKASRRKIFGGKAGRVRVGRSLREISNTSKDVQEDENEATVELGALIASVGSQSAADANNNDKMVYTAADMQKAESVSKEAVAIADSLLLRAESAEREVASLIKSMGELEDMRSKVRMLEEEKEKVLKSVDEKVASAKKKVYDKVQAQFSAGNKEFQQEHFSPAFKIELNTILFASTILAARTVSEQPRFSRQRPSAATLGTAQGTPC